MHKGIHEILERDGGVGAAASSKLIGSFIRYG